MGRLLPFLTGLLAAQRVAPTNVAPTPYPKCFAEEDLDRIFYELKQKPQGPRDEVIEIFDSKQRFGGVLTMHVAKIILEELMGYKVTLAFGTDELDEHALFERLMNGSTDVMFEMAVDTDGKDYKDFVNPTNRYDKAFPVEDALELGVVQQEGLYTAISPPSSSQASQCVSPDFWRSYSNPSVYDPWNNSKRVDPIYYISPPWQPPWCKDTPNNCAEVLATNTVAGDSVRSIITTNKWNLTIAWVGNNLTILAEERLRMGLPLLFLYYEPSTFITTWSSNLTRVTLPTFTHDCLALCKVPTDRPGCLKKKLPDSNSYVACDYRPFPVHKMYRSSWDSSTADDPYSYKYRDAVSMVRAISLYNTEQELMLQSINTSWPEELQRWEVACRWLIYTRAHRPLTPPSPSPQPALRSMAGGPIMLPPRWYGFVFNSPENVTRALVEPPVYYAGLSVTILFMTISLALQIALVLYQSSPVIKASSYRLCHAMIGGSYLVYSSVICVAMWPDEHSLNPWEDPEAAGFGCVLAPTVFGMGYMMMLGSVALKNWRIHKIFNYAKMGLRPPSDAVLLGWLLTLVAWEVVFDVLWFVFAQRPALRSVEADFSATNIHTITCEYGDRLLFWFSPKLAVLAFACYVGFKVRNVRHNFNESQKMAFASYAVFLEFAFGIALTFVHVEPAVRYILTGTLVCFGALNALLILFFPKFWSIYRIRQRGAMALNQTLLDTHSPHPAGSLPSSTTNSTRQIGYFKDQDFDIVGELVSLKTQLDAAMAEVARLKRGSTVAPILVPDGLSTSSRDRDDEDEPADDKSVMHFGSIPSLTRSFTNKPTSFANPGEQDKKTGDQ